MLAEDFCFNMTLKYRAVGKSGDSDAKSKAEKRNEIFMADLLTFTGLCPEKYLQDVYNYVTRTKKDKIIYLL